MSRLTNRFRSIHFVLTLSISVFAMVMMLIVALMMFSKFSAVLKENVSKNSVQTIDQAANTLDNYIDELMNISQTLAVQINVVPQEDSVEIQRILANAKALKRDIVAAGVYDLNGNIVAIAPGIRTVKPTVEISQQAWYSEAVSSNEDYAFHPPRVENLFRRYYPWVVTLSKKIYQLDENGLRRELILSIDMNFETIEQHCSNISIGKRGYMYIVDDNNNIIFHPQQQMIYAGIKTEDLAFLDGKGDGQYLSTMGEKIIVVKTLLNTPWRLVGISYLEEEYTTRNEIISFLAVVLVFDFLIIVMMSIAISQMITQPITGLTQAMEEVRGGNFTIRCLGGGLYEVDSLAKSFNVMVDRINTLMEQVKQEEKLLRKSELRALQAQINPHFLYNTLDSIMWMCEQNDGKRASLMVEALATLFRISISKGRELITLEEELMHAESYLTIQKMRYKDQFDYTFAVDPSLLSCRTLKIMLQPMIENAIYHGVDRMVDKGEIGILVFMEKGESGEDTVVMQVKDNGLGMPEEVAKDILRKPTGTSSYGIGVKNVNDRIEIYFGKEYGVEIESELDVGTTVTIRIPKLDDDSYEH